VAKIKDTIWMSRPSSEQVEVRLNDHPFSNTQPDAGGKDFIEALNPNSLKVLTAYGEPSLIVAKADENFQFERFVYSVAVGCITWLELS
jgi:glutaminyl-tRNA synthetase